MPGGGTKLGATTNNLAPVCLDLTRLMRRVGQHHTGVDRVEWAYLEWCLSLERPVFGFMRTALGYVLVDRAGLASFHSHMQSGSWPMAQGLSRLARKLTPLQRRVENWVRQLAIARTLPAGLPKLLHRHFPRGVIYFNTGHSNLSERVLSNFHSLTTDGSNGKTIVLIHDMIPLDFPEFQRAGTVTAFEARMRRVSRYASHLICNSHQTREDVTRHMTGYGRVPPAIVAHLGVRLNTQLGANLDAAPTPVQTAPQVPKPYMLIVGTIEPRKNHALLLDIWDKWDSAQEGPCPHLVICGARGWNNDALLARLDAARAAGKPILEINSADDATLVHLMQSATAMLFPSHYEGYGLPPIEAALLGVPVICGDLAIYREVLGTYPVYAKTSDAYAWRRAIHQTLQSDGADCSQAVNKNADFTGPSWDAHFNLVLKHFG
jgi:glycosyltransferase involved in cell wall biosynthesis